MERDEFGLPIDSICKKCKHRITTVFRMEDPEEPNEILISHGCTIAMEDVGERVVIRCNQFKNKLSLFEGEE